MTILFLNNNAVQCGVADYGRRVYDILKRHMVIQYAEVETLAQYYEVIERHRPAVILYNYHYATMGWLKDEVVDRGIQHVAITHEADLLFTPDKLIDTWLRPLFEDMQLPMSQLPTEIPVPIIGSFGFGFKEKNFVGIAELVKSQYSKAVIRLNIPFAYYGDRDGQLARTEADNVRRACIDTDIEVRVSHEYFSQRDMLVWLRENDINLFLYHSSYGRGLSSATDYALSAYRPIGVSSSEMFRHLPAELRVEQSSIASLMANWFSILQPVYASNSNAALVNKFKTILYGT